MSYECPSRLKPVFDFYGIDPHPTPGRADSMRLNYRNLNNGAKPGFIYFIRCEDCVKIGVTRIDPDKRLYELQLANPHKLSVFRSFHCEDPGEEAIMTQIQDVSSVQALLA